MKTILFLILIIISTTGLTQARDRVFRLGTYNEINEYLYTDEVIQFERMMSFYFHNLINRYRLKKKLHTLYWDEGLWLAARNHCVYMETGEFAHGEKPGNRNYTGASPTDRAYYATYGGIGTQVIGENIVMTSNQVDFFDHEMAFSLALECFEIWQKSPGHNRNMLERDYFAHGTAFIIFEGNIYGTTVFMGKPKQFQPNEIEIDWNEDELIEFKKSFEPKPLAVDPVEFDVTKEEAKMYFTIWGYMNEKAIKLDKTAQLATVKHTIYMIENKSYGNTEVKGLKDYFYPTTEKRFKKSGKSPFKLSKHILKEEIFTETFSKNDLTSYKAMEQVRSRLINITEGLSDVVAWGGNAQLVKDGESYLCIVDLIFVSPKT